VLDAGHPAVLAHRADWDGHTILAMHSFADDRLDAQLQLEPGIEEVVDCSGTRTPFRRRTGR
jgi:maltose alpha-D-glucosyltransferase/alpha-amylase